MFKYNKVFNTFIIIGLVASILVTAGRMDIERENKTVDVVLDYLELENLALQSQKGVSYWLNTFKEMGINKVGLSEESLDSLINEGKPLKAELMRDVVKDMEWRENIPESIQKKVDNNPIFDEDNILVSTNSLELYNFIKDGFQKRYDESRFVADEKFDNYFIYIYSGPRDTLYLPKIKYEDSTQKGFVEIREPIYSKLMYLSLGLDERKVSEIQEAGMSIIPRTVGYDGWNDEKFEKATIDSYKSLNMIPEYLIFAGSEIVGQDSGSKNLKRYIQDNNIKIAMIETTFQRENIEQAGLSEMVQATGYNTVRAFTTWPYIQNRFQYYNYQGSEEIENTFYRAITERNIRLIYFKPFKEYKDNFIYITDKEEYERMFKSLDNRIAEHGISMGSASVMRPYEVNQIFKIIITIGTVSAGMILLSGFIKLKEKIRVLLFAFISGLAIAAYFVSSTWAEILSALGASVVFASLAGLYLIRKGQTYLCDTKGDERLSKIIQLGIKDLLIASSISLVGALFTSSVISDINFLLEMNIFRGVKAAQLIPLMVYVFLYLAYLGLKTERRFETFNINIIKEILLTNIKVWVTLIGLVVLAAGYIYIARTGHETAVEPLAIEMIFRNFLEDHLIARPRNKEFIIAFPAVMLTVHALIRRMQWVPFILGLAAVIGQTSIINTFMHLRTPMYLSLTRTGYSLLFGIVLGIIYVIAAEVITKLYIKIRGEQRNA